MKENQKSSPIAPVIIAQPSEPMLKGRVVGCSLPAPGADICPIDRALSSRPTCPYDGLAYPHVCKGAQGKQRPNCPSLNILDPTECEHKVLQQIIYPTGTYRRCANCGKVLSQAE